MTNDTLILARRYFQAYVDKDRTAIDELIAEDFHFTSPIDNALDRETYFRICWPNGQLMQSFEILDGVGDGNRAFIVYEARTLAGKRFRNAEVHTSRDAKIVQVEVYFGWSLPHRASVGGHIENDGEGHA